MTISNINIMKYLIFTFYESRPQTNTHTRSVWKEVKLSIYSLHSKKLIPRCDSSVIHFRGIYLFTLQNNTAR